MVYLIDFLSILGGSTLFMFALVIVVKIYLFIRHKTPIKFIFTKDKLWHITKAISHITAILFLLRLAILLDGLWWLLFIIYMLVTDKYRNPKK